MYDREKRVPLCILFVWNESPLKLFSIGLKFSGCRVRVLVLLRVEADQ